MAIQSGEDLVMAMMNNLYTSETRLTQFLEELSREAQDKEVKDVLSVRAMLSKQNIANLDECFRLMGKQPSKNESRFAEVLKEDFQREFQTIQNPALKALYVLAQVRRVQNFHLAEYRSLATIARVMDRPAIAVLLEHNWADKAEFVESTRELVRGVATMAILGRARERAA